MSSDLTEKERRLLALAIGLVLMSKRWRALSKDSQLACSVVSIARARLALT